MVTLGDDVYALYTRRELRTRDVLAAVEGTGLGVEGADGDGTYLVVVDGEEPVLTLEETMDVSLDFLDYLKDVTGHDDISFCYLLRWPVDRTFPSLPDDERGLSITRDLTGRCEGLVAKAFESVVWPVAEPPHPPFDPVAYEGPEEELLDVVHLRWFARESVCDEPVAAWMRAVGRVAPDWLPTRYTGETRFLPLDAAGIAGAEGRRTADASGIGVYLQGPAPLHSVLLWSTSASEPHGMYCVECAVELSVLDDVAVARLYDVFTAVADELRAELALAEVLGGWTHAYSGDVVPDEEAQDPQDVGTDGLRGTDETALVGLPAEPVSWCYLGAAYRQMLRDFPDGLPAGADVGRTARGLGLRTSTRPLPGGELPRAWFPEEVRVRWRRTGFWSRERVLTPASRLPQWL